MDRLRFERYLQHRFNGLVFKTVTDVGSRCLRVEKAFSVDLDAVIAVNQLSELIERVKSPEGRQRLNYVGSDKDWYASLVNALKKYGAFRHEHPLPPKHQDSGSLK